MADPFASISAAQQELLNSVQNLAPLADHIQSAYAATCNTDGRKEAFSNAKTFVAQSLASVAYQVNEVATMMEQLFAQQTQQLSFLEDRMRLPRQQIDMYNEHIGRRNIASLTVPRKSTRSKKVVKIGADAPEVNSIPRITFSFDMLDKVGHGTTLEAEEPRLGSAQAYAQRGQHERLYSMARSKPKSEADTLVEDIYGSIGTVKARPPPPAAPGVPRAPSVPLVPSGGTVSSPRPNPPPKPGTLAGPPSTAAPMPTSAPPLPPVPAPAAPRPNVQEENFYEDVNVPDTHTSANEPIYQVPDAAAPPPLPPMSAPVVTAPPPTGIAFPPPPPPPPAAMKQGILGKALAVYDYVATQEDELTFKENEVIDIVAKNDDGWFEGVIGLRRGLFPGNYVQELGGESET